MSFLSGSSKALPAPAPKPLGIDESRASTNEQARPVPYVAGKQRVGVTWICEAFNQRADPVTTTTGGKGGSTYTSGYNYYASLAGLIAWGPSSGLYGILANGEVVWSGTLTRGAEDYVDVTVENYGELRIYWGTATQTQDAELLTSGFDHPPYARQAYIRIKSWFFGFNQTSVQNIELIVSRYPTVSWMTAAVAVQGDCNPVALVAEWLQDHRFGLGLADADLDTTGLDAIASALETEGVGLSPFLTKQTGARQLILQLCEYIDAVPIRTAAGKFSLALIRDPGAVATLAEADLVDEPAFDPDSWEAARTKTWIKFTNLDRNYKEDALPFRDGGAFQMKGDNEAQTLERPWVTRPNLAQKLVAAAGRAAALPQGKGTLRVKKSSAATLDVGSAFQLSYTHWGITDLLLRVRQKTLAKPGGQDITLEVATDRGYLNDVFYVPADDTPPAAGSYPPVAIADQMIFELPRGLAVDDQVSVALLAARPNRQTHSLNYHIRQEYALGSAQPKVPLTWFINDSNHGLVHETYSGPAIDKVQGLVVSVDSSYAAQLQSLTDGARLVIGIIAAGEGFREILIAIDMFTVSPGIYKFWVVRFRLSSYSLPSYTPGWRIYFADNGTAMFTRSYSFMGQQNSFAKHGAVDADYPATTDLLDETTGLLVTLDNADTTLDALTLGQALTNDLLLLVDDEIISIENVSLQGPGQYRVYGLRGRYDTRRQAHTTGAEVFIFERSRLNRLVDASQLYYLAQPNFKLQPIRFGQALALADATPMETTLTNRVAKPPAPLNLRCFSDGHVPSYTTGQDLTLTWNQISEKRGAFWSLWGNPVATGLPYIILEFRTTAGVLKQTVSTAAGAESYTYTNAALVSAFGSETDVLIHAYAAYGDNLVSLFYDALTVLKV